MDADQVWVSPGEDGWRVHKPGAIRDIAKTETKQEAMDIGQRVARNQSLEFIAQKQNGEIQIKNTYPRSRDKNPPRG